MRTLAKRSGYDICVTQFIQRCLTWVPFVIDTRFVGCYVQFYIDIFNIASSVTASGNGNKTFFFFFLNYSQCCVTVIYVQHGTKIKPGLSTRNPLGAHEGTVVGP